MRGILLALALAQVASAQPPSLEGIWSYATLTPFERPAELGSAEFFWFDRGEHVASLHGRKRASWVIEPPDGKVPPLTAEARARLTARNLDARDRPADGPENRSLQERCLAFNAGPPIGLGPYNNFLQIFQTRDAS